MLTLPDWAAGSAAAVGGERLSLVHQERRRRCDERALPPASCVSTSNAPQRFCTSATRRFLIAPLGAGKGAAALTALAELIRDRQRRHALVIAPKLVAETVWPQEIASWPHLQHLRVAVLNGTAERRRAAPARRGRRARLR